MATIVSTSSVDRLSGTNRAHALDRWIYVVSALWLIAIVLVGFIPDSLMKVGMVKAGLRAPFPPILHAHAALMGAFLLFLLMQTWLVANGRTAQHRAMGQVGAILAAALVVVGFILAPTMYRQLLGGLDVAPPEARGQLTGLIAVVEDILLLQTRAGVLFALFIGLGLAARDDDPGFHKRMMLIATAMPIGAAIDRMTWMPTTFPASPLSTHFAPLIALAPLLAWDLLRNRKLHRAYVVALAINVVAALLVELAWDKPWWHEAAHRLLAG